MSDKENKPIVMFTVAEAMAEYMGNPFAECLSDNEVHQVNSQTIHSEKYEKYPEPWIWAYSLDDSEQAILLYAPSHFNVNECIKAEIVTMEGGKDD